MTKFSDREDFLKKIVDGPLILPPSLLEAHQQCWEDARTLELGHGWAHTEPAVIDDGLTWLTEFESDRIVCAIEEPKSMVKLVEADEGLFEGDFKTVPPGLARGHSFEVKSSDKPAAIKAKSVKIHPQKTAEKPARTTVEEQVDEATSMIDNIKLDETSGFTFVRPNRPTTSKQNIWARAVDANHIPLDFDQVVPKLAYEYPFELDPFQKQAVYHLERNECVFVAAHTSAGKTVVAEYAIALAHKHLTKAIYTSPIKALSNQKFRDFKGTFGDVGLLTGDIQLNPEAACLIMTTEILRSMLYRGADLIADVEFVIFDEVHYVNDAERGVVWEEVIIMLPAHVTIIMLSATIPNTMEFADWVGRTKQREIYVISTLKRPVPLEHFVYVKKEPIRIVDAGKNFIENGYKEALAVSKPEGKVVPNTQGGLYRGAKQDKSLWTEITYMLKKKALLPVVIFTFSKKKCEENAEGMASMDLNGPGEKSAVHLFLESSLQRLRGTDSQLPQILRMREMLARDIAVHHSGLLPIMKEAVEILFSRGLIKVLFATETFAMGVNMPARTVVFSSIRKHDGIGFRNLLPGEYTQMAGRAGRRGLDATGMVIIACPEEVPSDLTLRQMILGLPTRLTSQFRLTYNMILNLLRVQALRMEEMIKKSFSENSAQKTVPDDELQVKRHEADLKAMERLDCVICEDDIAEYYGTSLAILSAGATIYSWLLHESKQASRYLEAGRVLVINTPFHRNVPAVVLKVNTTQNEDKTVSVFVLSSTEKDDPDCPYPPDHIAPPQTTSSYEIVSVKAAEIVKISKEKLKLSFAVPVGNQYHPKDLSSLQGQLIEFLKGSDLKEEMELPSSKLLDVDEKRLLRKALLEQLGYYRCNKCPDLLDHYRLHHQHQVLTEKLAELQFKMSDASMLLLPEYQARVRVLKQLEYIDPASNLVLLKGRVASEINTTDELITTELLFSNVFAEYEPAEIIALLSCMVFQEKHAAPPKLEGRLLAGQERIIETAKSLVTIQRELGVDLAMDQVIGSLRFGLVQVVYDWARGRPFKEITDLTDVLEGSIVRCIVRLDETCRELRSAAKIMGDPTLHKKMEDASNMIKRDICFASSLYY